MEVRCPYCENAIDCTDTESWGDVSCPTCGSTFSLVEDETVEFRGDVREQIGHFELIELIGRGSFGNVWKARDVELDRLVAIKVPRRGQLSLIESEQFLREARTAAQLNHPHIVSIHEVGRRDESVYLVTDFVEGVTLNDWLTGRTASVEQAVKWIGQLAEALEHAHQSNVVHRDLKPSNIMLAEDGSVHLTDFGLAKREFHDVNLTVDGDILGTPAYMSPEQARGKGRTADRRSDVYSLGVVLFQLLTGEQPFRGNRQMVLYQVINDDAPSLRRLNADLPKDADTICLKCLQKEPAARYQSARELADDLTRFADGRPILARPVGRVERCLRWCRRNPLVAGLSAACAASLLIGLALVTWFWRQSEENAIAAGKEADRAQLAAEREGEAHERTRRYLYVAHMNMAQQAFDFGDPDRVEEILTRHIPACPEDDLRGFEWYYWWQVSHQFRTSLRHPSPVYSVAVSPDGQSIATACRDGSLRIWDTEAEIAKELSGHQGAVFDLAYSPDGNWLVSGGRDKTVRFWNARSGASLAVLHGHEGFVFSVDFVAQSPDYATIVTGSADRTARVWEVDTKTWTGKTTVTLEEGDEEAGMGGHFDRVYAVDASADGTLIASGSLDRSIIIWDRLTGAIRHRLVGHRLEVLSVMFSPNGQLVASGSGDKTVRVWNVETGEAVGEPLTHTDRVRSLAFGTDGRTLVTASMDRTIRTWELDDRPPDGRPILRRRNRRQDFFYERMPASWLRTSLKAHAGSVNALAIAPTGEFLVSGGDDQTVRVWDEREWSVRRAFAGHRKSVNAVAFSGDGHRLVTGGNDNTVWIWNAESGQPVGKPFSSDDSVLAVAVAPDAKTLAWGGFDQQITLARWRDDQWMVDHIEGGHERAIAALLFGPRGEWLASASHDGTVKIWNPTTRKLIHACEGHSDRVQALAYAANEGLLVSAGRDGRVLFWNIDNGKNETEIIAHADRIWGLALSPDGSTLVSASADKTLKL